MEQVKLTLSLQKDIIDKAKKYAVAHQTSLSKMVERYFGFLTEKDNKEAAVSPWVREMTDGGGETPDFDHKSGYREHIVKAIQNHRQVIVTRNLKDYGISKIPVMTADQFLATLR